jgi:hypothetical protein
VSIFRVHEENKRAIEHVEREWNVVVRAIGKCGDDDKTGSNKCLGHESKDSCTGARGTTLDGCVCEAKARCLVLEDWKCRRQCRASQSMPKALRKRCEAKHGCFIDWLRTKKLMKLDFCQNLDVNHFTCLAHATPLSKF